MFISISSAIGRDLRTRSFFRRDIDTLLGQCRNAIVSLDFTGVTFISRSVADEICNLLRDCPNVTLKGMTGDVSMMYRVVAKARSHPRLFPDTNTTVVHLESLDQMTSFFNAL